MELGVFSLTDIHPAVDGGPRPTPGRRLDDVVAYGILADQLGLDVFGIGEHHSQDFAVSSPVVALAAVAQATERVRLVSTATVLTTLDPVRVYQDHATLDLLSHGRAEIVAGRSAFAEPFALFGVTRTSSTRFTPRSSTCCCSVATTSGSHGRGSHGPTCWTRRSPRGPWWTACRCGWESAARRPALCAPAISACR